MTVISHTAIDVATISETARADLLALRPHIIASALKMANDETEARQLTHLTFERAFAAPQREVSEPELDTRLWLFSLLRSEFHSVERQRQARRERGFTVASRQTATLETNS